MLCSAANFAFATAFELSIHALIISAAPRAFSNDFNTQVYWCCRFAFFVYFIRLTAPSGCWWQNYCINAGMRQPAIIAPNNNVDPYISYGSLVVADLLGSLRCAHSVPFHGSYYTYFTKTCVTSKRILLVD